MGDAVDSVDQAGRSGRTVDPRRHGRLLRLGGGARRSDPGREAGHRGRQRAAGAWWPRAPTRPGGSGSIRPCPRPWPADCAPTPSFWTADSTGTSRRAPSCTPSSTPSPRWWRGSRSTRPSSTWPGPSRLLGDGRPLPSHRSPGARGTRPHLLGRRGRTKLVAKLASRAAKPAADLSRGCEPGTGCSSWNPATGARLPPPPAHPGPVGGGAGHRRRLTGIGVATIGDLAALPQGTLERVLGAAHGRHLAALARGTTPAGRPGSGGEIDRSRGDIRHRPARSTHVWPNTWPAMVDAVCHPRLRDAQLSARTVTVKIRFGDFTMVTRSHCSGRAHRRSTGHRRGGRRSCSRSVDVSRRRAGSWVSSLSGFAGTGRSELPAEPAGRRSRRSREQRHAPMRRLGRRHGRRRGAVQRSWSGVTDAVDGIRSRFGRASVGPASLMGRDGLRVRERGTPNGDPRRHLIRARRPGDRTAPEADRRVRGPVGPDRTGRPEGGGDRFVRLGRHGVDRVL